MKTSGRNFDDQFVVGDYSSHRIFVVVRPPCRTQFAPPHSWSQRACCGLVPQNSKRLSRPWINPGICFVSRSTNTSRYPQVQPVIRPMPPPDHLPQKSTPNVALFQALSNFPINPKHGLQLSSAEDNFAHCKCTSTTNLQGKYHQLSIQLESKLKFIVVFSRFRCRIPSLRVAALGI